MPLNRSANDGGLYGTTPAIVAKEKNGRVEFLIGSVSPFGPVQFDEFEGKRFAEVYIKDLEAMGYTVTVPEALVEARKLSRERRDAQMNPKPFPKG